MEIDSLKSPRHGTCFPKLETSDPYMECESPRIEHSPTNVETGTPCIKSFFPSAECVLTVWAVSLWIRNVGFNNRNLLLKKTGICPIVVKVGTPYANLN